MTVPLHLLTPEQITGWYLSLTGEERQKWRNLAITTCLDVMRRSRDVILRQQAYQTAMTLLDLKPLPPWSH